MINKIAKNHKLFLVTELIFGNNPKANGKNRLGFGQRNWVDAYVQVGQQKHIITAALL